MKKYRKKPIVVEAVQINWATWNDVCEFVGDAIGPHNPAYNITEAEAADTCGDKGPGFIGLTLTTVHGHPTRFVHGDWILRDSKPGTFYPVNPEVFNETYEEIIS